MKRKMLKVLCCALAAGMVPAGCAKKPGSLQVEQDGVIKIGGVFPLSGEVAQYGVPCRNGIALAIREINEEGGINGKELALIPEDDEGKPEKTVNAYKKLTSQDNVRVVIGSLTSGCVKAITGLAQAQRVLLIAPAATAQDITSAGNFVFRTCFIDPFQGTVGGKFAFETLNARNAAILYDTGNDYSVGLAENFKKSFRDAGGNIAAEEAYGTGEKDFNAQITKIAQLKPDAVYLPDYYGTVALIAKQLRSHNITAPILGADGWDGLTNTAGDEVLNGYYSNHYASDSTEPAVIKFVSSYRETYGSDPASFAALGYDSVYMLKDALLAAQSFDINDVRAAFEETNGKYVTGNLRFDENRNPVKSAVMVEIVRDDSGRLVSVYKTTVNP